MIGTMFDPSPGPRARAWRPSPARIREIRAQRERERQYREFADYARTYGGGDGMPAPQLAGFSHFAGLSGLPRHLSDAGGSGATLPADVTEDPVGTGRDAAEGELAKSGPLAALYALPIWARVGVFVVLGTGALFAAGYVVKSFR